MERSDDSWIKWRNRQKHYKLLALFLFLLSVVSVCCLELIYKSLGVFFFVFFFYMPQWSGEAVSPQPERRLGAADGIINEREEDSEEDAACLLCGLREKPSLCITNTPRLKLHHRRSNASWKSMRGSRRQIWNQIKCWYATERTDVNLAKQIMCRFRLSSTRTPRCFIRSWR